MDGCKDKISVLALYLCVILLMFNTFCFIADVIPNIDIGSILSYYYYYYYYYYYHYYYHHHHITIIIIHF